MADQIHSVLVTLGIYIYLDWNTVGKGLGIVDIALFVRLEVEEIKSISFFVHGNMRVGFAIYLIW